MANNEVKEEIKETEQPAEATQDSAVQDQSVESNEATSELENAPVAEAPKKKKRKFRRQVQKGRAYVKSTYNNTMVSLTDMHGGLLAWSSAGLLGFKGAKKATTFAAAQVVNDVNEKVQKYGLKDIDVFVRGVGSGREAAVRALAQKGFNLTMIKDITPIPHNGCRPKKPRRV